MKGSSLDLWMIDGFFPLLSWKFRPAFFELKGNVQYPGMTFTALIADHYPVFTAFV